MSLQQHWNKIGKKDHKKETAERFKYDSGLEDSNFGLNGQDFPKYYTTEKEVVSSPLRRTTPKASSRRDQLIAHQETLENFCDDVGSLWCGFGSIPVLEEPPTPLVFMRDYVSPSRPCIIRNAMLVRDSRKSTSSNSNNNNNAALSLAVAHSFRNVERGTYHDQNHIITRPLQLSLDDIVNMDPSLKVVVDATPDGHGDCVRTVLDHAAGKQHRMFVTPEQRTMTLAEFRTQLREGRKGMRTRQGNHERDSDFHSNDNTNNDQQSGDDEFEEEELIDESDGKRIFELKGSRKPVRKEGNNLLDDMYAACTPTADAFHSSDPDEMFATCAPNAEAFNKATSDTQHYMMNTQNYMMNGIMSCNPLGEMGEIFLNLVEDKGDQCAETSATLGGEAKPVEPPKPPPPPPSVLYYSRQNDCFRKELPSIYKATRHVIPASIDFAEEAFGTGQPEAVNLWMGDERAVSSMHKDPYENLFYVCSGEKIFTLCPPADAPMLYESDFLSASFDSQQPRPKQKKFPKQRRWSVKTGYEDVEDSEDGNTSDSSEDDDIRLNQNNDNKRAKDGLTVDIEPIRPGPSLEEEARPAYVRWIEADVSALTDPDYEGHQMQKFPLLKYSHPIHQIRVQAGEMLYLPALWFHRVTQSRETVGLNYWYNMNFNSPHWCYFQLLNQLQLKQPDPLPPLNHAPLLDREHDDGAEKKNGF